MSKFVEKRPEIEARQFTALSKDLTADFIKWLGLGAQVTNTGYESLVVDVVVADEAVRLKQGDWIIKLESGDKRILTEAEFSTRYETTGISEPQRPLSLMETNFKVLVDAHGSASCGCRPHQCPPPVTPRGIPVTSLHSAQIRFWLNKALEKEGRPV